MISAIGFGACFVSCFDGRRLYYTTGWKPKLCVYVYRPRILSAAWEILGMGYEKRDELWRNLAYLAFNSAFYDLFYDLFMFYVTISALARAVLGNYESKWMGMASCFQVGWTLLFHGYKYFLLVLSDLVSFSLKSGFNSQGCLSLSDFVLNPPMGGDKANECDEAMTMWYLHDATRTALTM